MSAQKLKPSGVLGGVAGFLGFSVLAGVLVTAMVTPALAVTSLAANNTIGVFENLPDYIQIGAQSQQNVIYAMRDDKPVQIATIYKQNRQEVTWDQVSPFLKHAAVDGEDRRFYDHGGVDVPSVIRAVIKNQTDASAGQSGSSTLDMQLVKNILVQQAVAEAKTPQERTKLINEVTQATYDRKLKEMKLAIGLDKKYTKKEILLGYLNIVGMGSNTYGVESAAQQYFSVSAKDVTLAQAASLIAIVQQPSLQNLSNPKYYPANKLRRDQILDAMLELKHITKKQHDEAIATKIEDEVKLSPPSNGCRSAVVASAKVVCDYVTKVITSDPVGDAEANLRAVKAKPNATQNAIAQATEQVSLAKANAAPYLTALGSTVAERRANWDKGGYKIYTSVDLNLQDTAQGALDTWAPPTEARFDLGAAADTVEAGTGRILVMAQNKIFDDAGVVPGAPVDKSRTALNLSTDHPYGNSNGFETGSTYKVFDLANWLQNGHGLNDLVNGSGPQTYKPSDFTAPCDPGAIPGAPFPLRNDGNSRGGTMTVKQALIRSVNNAFMNMAKQSDLCSIRDTAKSMGAHRADFKTDLTVNPSAILGTNEQAPLTMAGAVATIGAGGLHCTPIIVDKVVDPNGKELPGQAKTCNQALTPEVAAGVANAMIGSMTGGTSSPGNPRDNVPIGGKTGTSPTTHQDWIMGTTTKTGTAVWTGNVTGKAPLRNYTNPITHSNYYTTSRFQILKAVIKSANTNPAYRGGAFPAASAAMLGGESATVPSVIGQTTENAKALLESLNYVYADGGPVASALPAGQVASTDPAPGAKTPVGATVTVYTSDGTLATTMPDVIGKNRHDAMAMLTSQTYGFSASNVTVVWVASSGNAPVPGDFCKVMASNPTAGAAAAKTDPVTLNIGTGLPASDPDATKPPSGPGCNP
ncbi:transglycosylase domain-containing protein [Parafrigoribacterium humi]|uniref:transglycosylase domain-containing protein n=1 Tax=Parafrigoribacterium humi TaxID=3144664 RepID=UPI0032EC4353